MTAGAAAFVTASLEAVAERVGDPAPLVYARLFAAHPEVEAAFAMDRTGAARGEMLAITLETLLDLAQEGRYAPAMIRAELVNHESWDVPASVFAVFYRTVRDAFREVLGADWTPDIDAAWTGLLERIDALIADQAAASGLALA